MEDKLKHNNAKMGLKVFDIDTGMAVSRLMLMSNTLSPVYNFKMQMYKRKP